MRPAVKQWLFLILLGASLVAMVVFARIRMSAELTPEQARVLATKLANQAFAENALLSRYDAMRPAVVLVPECWPPPEKKDGRWEFVLNRPAGPQATVSFDARGLHPQVRISYPEQ
jgi:hypothetical protein